LKRISFDIAHFHEKAEEDRIVEAILRNRPDVVGFTTFLWNVEKTNRVCSRLKEKTPSLTVVWGGIEASTRAREIMESYPSVDVVVRGEGEISFVDLLKNIGVGRRGKLSSVKGIVYREGDRIVSTPRRNCIKDLSVLPSAFLSAENDDAVGALTSVETMRGCKNQCAFCVWPHYGNLRYFPLDRVLREIKYLLAHPKVKSIFFNDADFLFSKDRSLAIWDTVVNHNRANKRCTFIVNPETFEPEQIDYLAAHRGGNMELLCAFHTTNPALNELLNRKVDVDRVKNNMSQLVSRCSHHRIVMEFTYAWPQQTMDMFIHETLDVVVRARPQHIYGCHFLVLPGTRFYQHPERYGILDFQRHPPYEVLETTTMKREEIANLENICRSIFSIYSKSYIHKSFFYLMPFIESKSFGMLYAELAMSLISNGGVDFLKEPFVRRHYLTYVDQLRRDHKLADRVYDEFLRIVDMESQAAPASPVDRTRYND